MTRGWPGRAGRRRRSRVANHFGNKKGPLAGANGPSLGRKRPRRAAGTRRNRVTALQQYAPAPHKRQASLTYWPAKFPASRRRAPVGADADRLRKTNRLPDRSSRKRRLARTRYSLRPNLAVPANRVSVRTAGIRAVCINLFGSTLSRVKEWRSMLDLGSIGPPTTGPAPLLKVSTPPRARPRCRRKRIENLDLQ